MIRPKGEVPFPDNSWLKRYNDQKKWHDIREGQAMMDIKRYYPEDVERLVRNAKEGCMVIATPYFELMFLQDSAYQDEL
jgi:hypothetical protein